MKINCTYDACMGVNGVVNVKENTHGGHWPCRLLGGSNSVE